MSTSFERSPQPYVRAAGILYLAIILLGLFGETVVRGTLFIAGDPAATAQAIAASPWLWRAGLVGDLLMHVCDVPVIVVFYLLLKPVDHTLALLTTLMNLVQTAVLGANKLNLLLPLFLQEDHAYLQVFTPEQLQTLSYLAIKTHSYGFGIGLIFFGFASVVRGYLIYRSGFFPRILGVLLLIAGLAYLLNSFALLLSPALAAALFPGALIPAFVGEFSLCVWLIVKGIDLEQWSRRMVR
jgi:hypothetical protein